MTSSASPVSDPAKFAIGLVWAIAMVLVYNVLTETAPLLPGSETTHGYEVQLFTWIPAYLSLP